MTFLTKMMEMLVERGMWPKDAAVVMSIYQNEGCDPAMAKRLDDDMEGYPIQTKAAVWYGVKIIALEWIDDHTPNVWYREQFTNNPQGEK